MMTDESEIHARFIPSATGLIAHYLQEDKYNLGITHELPVVGFFQQPDTDDEPYVIAAACLRNGAVQPACDVIDVRDGFGDCPVRFIEITADGACPSDSAIAAAQYRVQRSLQQRTAKTNTENS